MSSSLRSRDATVFGREGTGPVRVLAEVVQRRRDGAYWTLTVSAPEIAERALPGQFVDVGVAAPGTILRRPFSIHRVSRQGPFAGTVDFVFDAHGPGTQWLAQRQAHESLDVVGPVGSAFPVPQQRVPCLLVGGGYGVAPLFFLGERLTAQGLRVDMIAGASTQDRLFNVIEAKRNTASVTFTTEDGSLGEQGQVTDVLERVIGECGSRVLYACGPMPMLRAVSTLARELELPCQIAVEEHMACGVGVCWTCVVPVRNKTGTVRMRRACIDGPVFNGARLAWDHTRWAAPGAPADHDAGDAPEPAGAAGTEPRGDGTGTPRDGTEPRGAT